MSNVITLKNRIMPMTEEQIGKVDRLTEALRDKPQVDIQTFHSLHGGVYCRTVSIPAGTVCAGALIKVPTTLIISGDATFYIGSESVRITGYQIIIGSANRKQACFAHGDTAMTMIHRTNAQTVEEAEAECTDELVGILSKRPGAMNNIMIGELS